MMYGTTTNDRYLNFDAQAPMRMQGIDLMALPFLWNDLVALRDLEALGLGVYRLGRGHSIGFTDDAVHPHDRWLFKTTLKEYWVRIPAKHLNPGAVFEGEIGRDLHEELKTLRRLCDSARDIPYTEHIKPVDILQRLLLLGGPNAANARLIGHLPERVAPRDLHGLFYHYPQWRDANPEFKGMPQGLALRMHGLGALLDTGYPFAVSG